MGHSLRTQRGVQVEALPLWLGLPVQCSRLSQRPTVVVDQLVASRADAIVRRDVVVREVHPVTLSGPIWNFADASPDHAATHEDESG